MIRKSLIFAAETLRGRSIHISDKLPTFFLFCFFGLKFFSLMRGLVFYRKLIFVGSRTNISHKRYCFAARGVEIRSGCIIDCLSDFGLTIGRGVSIGDFCIIRCSGSLSDLGHGIVIGNNVGIGDFAHIGGAGPVKIGDDTIAGAYLSIHPENHNFTSKFKPIRLQGVTRQGITVGRDCWIGAKVTFLDGSRIGDGCVVAAGAVVTKSFPRPGPHRRCPCSHN